ncbi:MAG: DUF5662 family protein [Johnsonella sp.]|nr:DUF5662 family protein [Johnsonella sp.]
MQINNVFKHFNTITKHKLRVMDLCFKVGMIRQGLLHDLSKYSPEEFLSGVRYYQGNKSPNAAEKLENGYSRAWLHHKGRNKHHFEYWIDYSLRPEEGLIGMKMPLRYVLEMTCDRIAASIIYSKDQYHDGIPWEYYSQRESQAIHLHPETKALLEELLIMNRDRGLKKTLAYMRWLLKHPYVYEGKEYKA